jgi:hypothetical protein
MKTFFYISFFVGVLKVNDKNGRIRIHFSEAWIRGSGSTPKCHGSATPVLGLNSLTFISNKSPRRRYP